MKFNNFISIAFTAAATMPLGAMDKDDCSTTVRVHRHKRAIETQFETVTVFVEGSSKTAVVNSVATSTISTSEPSDTISASSSSSSSSIQKTSTIPSSSTSSATHSKSSVASSSASSSSSTTSSSSSSYPTGDLDNFSDPTEKFEDGTISCDDFPSGQGVVALDHLGFGGWSGIEYIHSDDDIETGGKCREGAYCSYACQSGMSKTQWPSDQPSSGVSIGGLKCKNGKLYRSNTDSDYLCEWGKDKAYINNQVGKQVAICRTDYPGTENMVIPTIVELGKKVPLAVPDEDTYYKWEGQKTSAQYYVNNAGVDWEKGCSWATSDDDYGNWAPLNFGAGYTDGIAYLSLIPNPNNKKGLNFNVEIVAYDGDATVSGSCVYEDGKYNGDGSDGCTVGVTKGKAQFRLYT